MEHDMKGWAELLLTVLSLVGVVPPLRRWMAIGRRAKTASLVAQLAQEVMVAVARRRGLAPAQVANLEEAVELLRQRLIASGVDPKKAANIARSALEGAMHPNPDAELADALALDPGLVDGSQPMP